VDDYPGEVGRSFAKPVIKVDVALLKSATDVLVVQTMSYINYGELEI
jgi:hypothetical protein